MKGDFGIQRKFHSKREQQRRIRFYLICAVSVFVLALSAYGILYSGSFNIQRVDVSGTQALSASDIQRNVEVGMVRPHVFSVSGLNIFLFSTQSAEAALLDMFPRIVSVRVARHIFSRSVSVNISEQQATGLLCGPDGECYLFNADGLVFAQATEANHSLLVVKEDPLPPISLPNQKYSSATIQFMSDVKRYVKDRAGVDLLSFTLMNPYGDIEADTSAGDKIYFSMDYGADKQGEILKNVLTQNIKDQAQGLAYIDLRIENRAYYK